MAKQNNIKLLLNNQKVNMKIHKVGRVLLVRSLFFWGAATAIAAPQVEEPVQIQNSLGGQLSSPGQQAVSRQFTFTSGATIRKQLLAIGGGDGSTAVCKLSSVGGDQKGVKLPEGLTFSPNCELAGVAAAVPSAQTHDYRIELSDQQGGYTAKNIRITINPPLMVKCDPVPMTAGGRIIVSQLPCQARGGTGETTVAYIGPDGSILKELPGGLKIDEKGGISGKVPDNADELKGVEVQFADAGGAAVRTPISLDIRPPISMDVENVVFTASDQSGRPVDPPRPVADISGGSGVVTVEILEEDGKQAAKLPDGLRFNGITKRFEGFVPIAKDVGEKKYLLKATDQGGGSIERVFVLKVNPPLQLS
ncbi:putative Ig domain-containing protein [Paraburkholderia kururiensis]|uniref:putative Ig domain-containing protein n=1 Tax=Paraburkholderia kururiensis TaxID=984307 RepID=UPI000F89397B|nr:putative Ig domain-containing protein [Paraburkholderia kururiensis]